MPASQALQLAGAAIPMHMFGREPLAAEREFAKLVMEQQPKLQALYAGWMASLHPAAWKEVEEMARAALRPFKIDLVPVIERLGLKRVIEQVGFKRVLEEIGSKRILEEIGVDRFLAGLSPADRRELKRRL